MAVEIDPLTGSPILTDNKAASPALNPVSSSDDETKSERSQDVSVDIPSGGVGVGDSSKDFTVEKVPSVPSTIVPPVNVRELGLVTEKVQLSKELSEIMNEYGGRESDIPVNHVYWELLNKIRSL